MTLTASETCEAIANIIDSEPERFNMDTWERWNQCGTTACIAGHTALLHGDGLAANKNYVHTFIHLDGKRATDFIPDKVWRERQAERLGLTPEAGEMMFHETTNIWDTDEDGIGDKPRFSKVLRQLEKELADRDADDLIDADELGRIAAEALRRQHRKEKTTETAFSPAETCREVANIIDSEPDRFSMDTWERKNQCGTTACIAGHTALLHGDSMDAHPNRAEAAGEAMEFRPSSEWIDRQACRLGLNGRAGRTLFNRTSRIWNIAAVLLWREKRYSIILRHLAAELERRETDELLTSDELRQIVDKAVAEKALS